MIYYNFADWEMTQLLPEKEPYTKGREAFFYWEIEGEKVIATFEGAFKLSDNPKVLSDVWGFREIMDYLNNKGYYLTRLANLNNPKWCKIEAIYYSGKEQGRVLKDFVSYNYDSSFNEAIIYCLNKINNGNT